ncbi:MAG: DUF3737 family protein [Clostridia bacterium]|nr:DUF3737 family protein [Clostridia bacterium]
MKVENKTFDRERALYNIKDSDIENCVFAGPADGESAMKEARNINVSSCSFSLRYPLWHVEKFTLTDSKMNELTRAAVWYSSDGKIKNCLLGGIKAVRECSRIDIDSCRIVSPEFGWKSSDITLKNSSAESEYFFFDSENIRLENIRMTGKYSFQYVRNLEIDSCEFDTKDAFWHVRNATVRNSVIRGEYLGWYSDGLTLINCKITGTQPLCYCRNLKLVNCTMEGADLAFEYSDVDAQVTSELISVKNPKSGIIRAKAIGEIINDAPAYECDCEIITG